MGYSVSVKFQNQKEQEAMKLFLEDNQEIINKLSKLQMGSPNMSHGNEVQTGDNLSYAPQQKYLLGFHGTGIPQYLWDLCAWMAVKSTVRDTKQKPYLYYDSKRMKITFDPTNTQNTLVDAEGIPIQTQAHIDSVAWFKKFFSAGAQFSEQKALMTELNNKWIAYQPTVAATPKKTPKAKV